MRAILVLRITARKEFLIVRGRREKGIWREEKRGRAKVFNTKGRRGETGGNRENTTSFREYFKPSNQEPCLYNS